MAEPVEKHQNNSGPTALLPFLFLASCEVVSSLAAFVPVASFLSSRYLCKRHSWLISLPGLQQSYTGSHVAFSSCSGTNPTFCKTRDPLRSQGPATFQQLKWPAFFCWRNEFASAMQLVAGCSTRNWKKKNKIKIFWLATFKEVLYSLSRPSRTQES